MQADLKMVQMTITRATEHILAQAPPNLDIMKALDEAYNTLTILMRENPPRAAVNEKYDAGTVYEEPDALSKALEQADAEIPAPE